VTTTQSDTVAIERPRRVRVSLTSFAILLTAVALAALGQVMLKHGMVQATAFAKPHHQSLARTAALNPWVVTGLLVFGLSAIAWLATLSRLPLNLAYPFNALGYLAILGASVVVLHERANIWTLIGSSMVVVGLIVIVTMGPHPPVPS
jgi:drug/metabolite transporter (DMT)-like permease